MNMECDHLNGWILKKKEKGSHMLTSHQKLVNPRDIAGNAEEEAIDSERLSNSVYHDFITLWEMLFIQLLIRKM